MSLKKCTIHTPLGRMTAASEGGALSGLRFDGQRYDVVYGDGWAEDEDFALFVSLKEQLAAYFSGQLSRFDIPLSFSGTEFQRSVWEALKAIPFGTTTSYGAIARLLGGRGISARAVGAAVGRNPVSLIVPCHRVVGADGSLTGYAGGLDRKAALLALEANVPSQRES